ncbi:hypothetical protein FGO68_gene16183 [Halteria grandinella]|uniref:Uncharacterized protein n=1 Tax=Halteria grandinella TaxID=5974 RepID=A0A8J8T647_HALGN|nr:hypothetical protein FGO68_gene16183 [Halteria grandinella]
MKETSSQSKQVLKGDKQFASLVRRKQHQFMDANTRNSLVLSSQGGRIANAIQRSPKQRQIIQQTLEKISDYYKQYSKIGTQPIDHENNNTRLVNF